MYSNLPMPMRLPTPATRQALLNPTKMMTNQVRKKRRRQKKLQLYLLMLHLLHKGTLS